MGHLRRGASGRRTADRELRRWELAIRGLEGASRRARALSAGVDTERSTRQVTTAAR